MKILAATALAVGFVILLARPTFAAPDIRVAETAAPQDAAAPKDATTSKEKAKAKPLTQQQQKMKDCGAKWTEEKAKTGVKGRTAYRKFMKDCLKNPPA